MICIRGICNMFLNVSVREVRCVYCSCFQSGVLYLHKYFCLLFRWFAGKQIRNVGSIGGNIITGSPISDLNPIFMASGCKLTLASKHKKRTVDFDQNFYTGYRKSILEPNEILVSITIPFTRQNEYFVAFKQVRTYLVKMSLPNLFLKALQIKRIR